MRTTKRLKSRKKSALALLKTKLKITGFYLSGKIPWSKGYIEARDEYILRALHIFRPGAGGIPFGYGKGFDERVVEIPWVYQKINDRPGLLWDVGSVLNRENLVLQSKIQKKQVIISNLNPETKNLNFLGVSYLYEDCVQSVLQDEIFDEVLCISTLEHIGFDNKKYTGAAQSKKNKRLFLQAVSNFKAKLKKGGHALVTVPFGQRVDHGWFQVFDASLIQKVITAFQPKKHTLDIYQCSRDGWRLSNMNACSRSVFHDWGDARQCGGNIAGSEAVACIALQK